MAPLRRLAQLLSPDTYVAYVPPPPTTTTDVVADGEGAAADAAGGQDGVTDCAPEVDTPTAAAETPA